jgi:hypothetical protein
VKVVRALLVEAQARGPAPLHQRSQRPEEKYHGSEAHGRNQPSHHFIELHTFDTPQVLQETYLTGGPSKGKLIPKKVLRQRRSSDHLTNIFVR